MRILIVNGYSLNELGNQRFLNYQNTIKYVFLQQKPLVDSQTQIYVRDSSNLDDFLFEEETGYTSTHAERQFDFVDLIFIEMESNLRPWSQFAHKIVTLIRMCLRANKLLFASSSAMQVLVFLVASNFECPIKIINGVNGSHLGDLSKINQDITKLQKKSNGIKNFFLDNVTGDLYGVGKHTSTQELTWQPIGNTGIHQRRSAEEFNTIGKFVIKAPIYRPKSSSNIGVYTSLSNEEKIYVLKSHIHNELLRDIPQQFIAFSPHQWDIHPFNYKNPNKTFNILAETSRGPSIIQLTDNIIATQFCIDRKYENTCTLLKNFIEIQLMKVRGTNINTLSIAQADNDIKVKLQSEIGQIMNEKQVNLNLEVLAKFQGDQFVSKQSRPQRIVVDNNAIQLFKSQIRIKNHRNISAKQILSLDDKSLLMYIIYQYHLQNREQEGGKDHYQYHPFKKNQTEIRQMLHPEIKKEGIPSNFQQWTPGSNEQSNKILQWKRPQNAISTPNHKKQQYFQNITSLDQGIKFEDPKEKEKKEKIETDKLIIGTRWFKTSLDSKINYQDNQIKQNSNQTPRSIVMKTSDKQKWISCQFNCL